MFGIGDRGFYVRPGESVTDRHAQEFACEGHQFIEPEGLESHFRPKVACVRQVRLGREVIPRDDCSRYVSQSRDGSQRAEELDSARERHSQVENQRMRHVLASEGDRLFARQCGPHLEALQAQRSGKGIGDADVVIDEENSS